MSRTQGIGEPILEETFGQTHGDGQKILQTFAFFCRHRNKGYVLTKVADLIVAFEVEAVLGELTNRLPVPFLKQGSDILALFSEGFDERTSGLATPAVNTVNLVACNHERGSGLFENVERFNGLRLQSLHDVDDQDRDVRHGSSTVSQRGKGMMTGCVDEQQPR